MNNRAFNADCLPELAQYPDNYFDLLIADPPYGIGMDKNAGKSKSYTNKNWDNCPPPKEYFVEAMRVSKNQIIWGANHFISLIPYDSACWLVWDKRENIIPQRTFADLEMAWTSFTSPARMFRHYWDGFLQKNKEARIHQTQKPVKLYEWTLMNYAEPGQKILDTHLGSGSSRIAAYNLGFDFTGYEKDADHFTDQEKRFKEVTAQTTLF